MEIESRLSSCQGLGSGELGMNANEDGFSFQGDRNVLKLHSCDSCTTHLVIY